MPAVGLTFVRNRVNDINVPIYELKSGSVVVNENTTLNVELEKRKATVIFSSMSGKETNALYIHVYLNGNLIKTISDSTDIPFTVTCDIGDVLTTQGGVVQYYFNGEYYEATTSTGGTTHTITEYNNTITDLYIASCCVPYYSQILYADSTTKSAEDVRVGDILLGYKENTSEFVNVKVLDVIKTHRKDLCKIEFDDDTFMELTPEHPILTTSGWCVYDVSIRSAYSESIALKTLEVGMQVLQTNYVSKTIKNIQLVILDNKMDTYTFNTSEGVDTYIAEGCVVHNVCHGGGSN